MVIRQLEFAVTVDSEARRTNESYAMHDFRQVTDEFKQPYYFK
jgi:hypothetical protein